MALNRRRRFFMKPQYGSLSVGLLVGAVLIVVAIFLAVEFKYGASRLLGG